MMNTKELRTIITNRLKTAGNAEAAAISAVLLMRGLNLTKTELIIGDYVPTNEQIKLLDEWVKRAEKDEPVQYIVGETEFMSLKFKVYKGVLIPRADTEILVSEVLERVKDKKSPVIWDLCCGSGCIGISLAYYKKDLSARLADISRTALNVSDDNINEYNLSDRVKTVCFDVLTDEMPCAADCVVSNPPYIAHDVIGGLDKNVRCFEPSLALDGGADGLDFYRKIAANAKIKDGGILAFEIGFDRKDEVEEILEQKRYQNIKTVNDIENRPRVVIGTR